MEGDYKYSAGNQSVANLGILDADTDRQEGGAEDGGRLKVIWKEKQWDARAVSWTLEDCKGSVS